MVKNIDEVLEVVVVIDANFNEFSEKRPSTFLKKVIINQNAIDMNLFEKTRRSLNCITKTMKAIWEIEENLLCVGKRREIIPKKQTDDGLLHQDRTGSEWEARHQLLQEGC